MGDIALAYRPLPSISLACFVSMGVEKFRLTRDPYSLRSFHLLSMSNHASNCIVAASQERPKFTSWRIELGFVDNAFGGFGVISVK